MKHPRNLANYRAYMRRYMQDRYYRRRAEAIERLGGQCVDCGCADPDALEFDHKNRRAKSFDVAKAFASMAQHRLDREVAKCVLRCRPCHEVKTRTDLGQVLRAPHLIAHRDRLAS